MWWPKLIHRTTSTKCFKILPEGQWWIKQLCEQFNYSCSVTKCVRLTYMEWCDLLFLVSHWVENLSYKQWKPGYNGPIPLFVSDAPSYDGNFQRVLYKCWIVTQGNIHSRQVHVLMNFKIIRLYIVYTHYLKILSSVCTLYSYYSFSWKEHVKITKGASLDFRLGL